MKTNSRLALFLVLLVIGQELCLARHAYQKFARNHRLEKREAKKEEKSVAIRSNRQKRGVGTIVLAVTLTTSILSIGSEVYFAIDKCCGVYPQACRDRDEFEQIEERLKVTTKEIDDKALDTENLKEDIVQSNYKLQEMWTQMQLIGEYTDEMIQTLGPEIVKQMNTKWAEIEDQLKAKNASVMAMSYADIENEYDTYFKSFKTTMIGMSNFLGLTVVAVGAVAFKYYKNTQINLMIDELSSGKGHRQLTNARNAKAAKLLGYSGADFNSYIKKTATAQVNAKLGITSRFNTIFNAINVVGGLLSVGFDAYAIISRFQYCADRQKQVAKALTDLKKTEVDVDEVNTNVTDYFNYLDTEGWDFITSQVANAQFQETIRDFQSLAEGSDSITPDLTSARDTIDHFLNNINGSISDTKETYNLIDQLNTALKGINVRMKCYVNRGRLLKHVSDQCKIGADSLRNLYDNSVATFGVDGDQCILDDQGNAYTTFEGMEKSIQDLAAQENYNPDCILNSESKKNEACGYKDDGYSESQIATKMGLTTVQIQHFLSDCPEPELSPRDVTLICRFSMMGDTAADIKSFLLLPQSVSTIQNVIDTQC